MMSTVVSKVLANDAAEFVSLIMVYTEPGFMSGTVLAAVEKLTARMKSPEANSDTTNSTGNSTIFQLRPHMIQHLHIKTLSAITIFT